MVTLTALDHLKHKKMETKHTIIGLQANLRKLDNAIGSMETGINIGDTVSYTHSDKKGVVVRRRATVVGFEDWIGSQWTLHVVSIRRDGSDGAQMNVYPYQEYRKEEVSE